MAMVVGDRAAIVLLTSSVRECTISSVIDRWSLLLAGSWKRETDSGKLAVESIRYDIPLDS